MYMTKEEFKSKKEIQIQHKVSYRKQGLYHHPCISIYEFA